MPNAGPFVPCLITHGTVTSLTKESEPKVMTGLEHLIAQGEPVGEAAKHSDFKSYIADCVETFSANDQKFLAGNAYDASCFFFFFALYALANVSMESDSSSSDSAKPQKEASSSPPPPPLAREVVVTKDQWRDSISKSIY